MQFYKYRHVTASSRIPNLYLVDVVLKFNKSINEYIERIEAVYKIDNIQYPDISTLAHLKRKVLCEYLLLSSSTSTHA